LEITHRAYMLDLAAELVTNNRNKEYGEPEENMERTAKLFGAYLGNRKGSEITGRDIAVFGIILKLGRLAGNPDKLDSWTDIAGYASIGYELAVIPTEATDGFS